MSWQVYYIQAKSYYVINCIGLYLYLCTNLLGSFGSSDPCMVKIPNVLVFLTGLLHSIASEAVVRLPEFKPGELSKTAWAYATCGFREGRPSKHFEWTEIVADSDDSRNLQSLWHLHLIIASFCAYLSNFHVPKASSLALWPSPPFIALMASRPKAFQIWFGPSPHWSLQTWSYKGQWLKSQKKRWQSPHWPRPKSSIHRIWLTRRGHLRSFFTETMNSSQEFPSLQRSR